MHLKRKTMGKIWPAPRTGTKYVAVPLHEKENSIPLIVVMREVLGIVKNKKELKKALREKQIAVNGRIVKETNYPLCLYDSLSIPGIKKHYKIVMEARRFAAKEISESEANHKLYKIIGKKILAGKKTQINLSSGKNIISNEKLNTGDFVVLNNKDNKILKIISLKKDDGVIVIAGKHTGKSGKIKEIVGQGDYKIAVVKTNSGEIKANIKNIFAKE
jgi:small subunit ribosomal protein S4e